jgi:hypothetical protein
MQSFQFLVLASFLGVLPLQSKQMSTVELVDPCTGLSDAQCCEQTLQVAGFRASGAQLPVAAQKTARLSCMSTDRVVPAGACRSLGTSRGLPASDVQAMCAPAQVQQCGKAEACQQCVESLKKLSYKNPQPACHAVTHAPARVDNVVVIRHGADKGEGVEIHKRRTVLP